MYIRLISTNKQPPISRNYFLKLPHRPENSLVVLRNGSLCSEVYFSPQTKLSIRVATKKTSRTTIGNWRLTGSNPIVSVKIGSHLTRKQDS